MNEAPPVDERARFLDAFRASLAQEAFAKLILGTYQGAEPDLVKLIVRPVIIKGQKRLCCLYHYRTKDITKNLAMDAGAATLEGLLGKTFKSAHLFTVNDDLHLKIDSQGQVRVARSKPTQADHVSTQHDRQKTRLLDPGLPFLQDLGVTDQKHQILPSMSHKWKQINKFLEVFAHTFSESELPGRKNVRVVDFGAGKGYLTFAVHHWLRNTLGVEATVTGIELREDLVQLGNEVAARRHCEGLNFVQGSLQDAPPVDMDVLIALHACDTATDRAIQLGLLARAAVLLCAPCCHKQIRPQIKAPEVLRPLMRFGVHFGQEADMLTDSLRALLLEAAGYRVNVFEFISLEHTDKNKMISAVRSASPVPVERVRAQIAALKEFYGVQEHELERLLSQG
jgi:SAM-dependent methyltransferase